GAKHVAVGGCSNLRHQLFSQLGPGLRITKERSNSDQQFLEKEVRFLRIFPQVTHVVVHRVDTMQAHASLQASIDRGLLVEREIMARLRAQEHEYLLQSPAILGAEVGSVMYVREIRQVV